MSELIVELNEGELKTLGIDSIVEELVRSKILCRDQGYYHFAHLARGIERYAKAQGMHISDDVARLIATIAYRVMEKVAEEPS